jgi:hypothetical protein
MHLNLCFQPLVVIAQTALRRVKPTSGVGTGVTTPSGITVLKCHQTLWVARPRGLVVRCERGTLWLAFDGQPLDVVLEPGEQRVCLEDARLSIHAMTSASLRLQTAPRA